VIIRNTETGEYVGLKCDICPTMAPPASEILRGHGLNRMGWYCHGGTHICAECPHPRSAAEMVAERHAVQPRKTDRNV
jgi:hypothetical protein